MKRRRQRGITFVELLTVIVIISILAGISYGVGSSAIARGEQTSCASRMRQVYIGMDLYCQDNGGWEHAPPSLASVSGYVPPSVFRCPSEHSITPNAQGLYPAQALLLKPSSWVPYEISFAYVHDYGSLPAWNDLLTQAHVGVIACQWHGTLTPKAGAASLQWSQPRTGPIQRICFDGHLFVWKRHDLLTINTADLFYWPDLFHVNK